ncbi:hypothetical protein S83_053664 [Arachis hypogaea]
MGWELLFWLLLCFPLNIAFFASSFYQVLILSDLEDDYMNPFDASSRVNYFVVPEFIGQGLLCVLCLLTDFALQCANEGSQVFPLLCVYGLNGGIRFAFDDHLNQLPVDALPGISLVHVPVDSIALFNIPFGAYNLKALASVNSRLYRCFLCSLHPSLQKDYGMRTGEMLWYYSREIDYQPVGLFR